jgi:S-formylglutathione hydrolase FrmB
VKATYPAADPERTYLDGVSMGGAGAMTLGLLHARHFCHVRASFGQAIPRNHRPARLAQLAGLWGTLTLTRVR